MGLKTKVAYGAAAAFFTWLLWPKKAHARSVVVLDTPKSQDIVIDERPVAQDEPKPAAKAPAKKPGGKKAAPKPAADEGQLSNAQAQAALDQVWPLLTAGRATDDQRHEALRWAQQIGDTTRAAEIIKQLGGP
jgi:hypothetical protein